MRLKTGVFSPLSKLSSVETCHTVSSDHSEQEVTSIRIADDIKNSVHFSTIWKISSIMHELILKGEKLQGYGHKNGSPYEVFIKRYSPTNFSTKCS